MNSLDIMKILHLELPIKEIIRVIYYVSINQYLKGFQDYNILEMDYSPKWFFFEKSIRITYCGFRGLL